MIKWSWLTYFLSIILALTEPMRWGLQSIGNIMEQIFHTLQGFSMLDIFAGIVLVAHSERISLPTVPSSGGVYDTGVRKHWQTQKPNEDKYVQRFIDMSVGMYTWTGELKRFMEWIVRPLVVLKTIFYLKPYHLYQYSRRRTEVVGDGLLNLKTAAFLAGSNTALGDLKYASFANGIFQTPFCIVADRKTRSIVVTILGSSSLEDWLTGAVIPTEDIPRELKGQEFKELTVKVRQPNGTIRDEARSQANLDLGDGKKIGVHSKMYLCAKSMYGDVERILFSLFSDPKLIGEQYENYKIVVTGHSLGAGVASLLTLMLRKVWKDRVRGYCFSPPGCMVDSDGVKETRESILTLFVGDDLVPRCSWHSISKLRDDVQRAMSQPNFKTSTDGVDPLKGRALRYILAKLISLPIYGEGLKHLFLKPFGLGTYLKFGPVHIGTVPSNTASHHRPSTVHVGNAGNDNDKGKVAPTIAEGQTNQEISSKETHLTSAVDQNQQSLEVDGMARIAEDKGEEVPSNVLMDLQAAVPSIDAMNHPSNDEVSHQHRAEKKKGRGKKNKENGQVNHGPVPTNGSVSTNEAPHSPKIIEKDNMDNDNDKGKISLTTSEDPIPSNRASHNRQITVHVDNAGNENDKGKVAPTIAEDRTSREVSSQGTHLTTAVDLDVDGMVRLYAPGMLQQLTEDKNGEITPKWIAPMDLQALVLSKDMINHHAPRLVRRVVKNQHPITYYVPFMWRCPFIHWFADHIPGMPVFG